MSKPTLIDRLRETIETLEGVYRLPGHANDVRQAIARIEAADSSLSQLVQTHAYCEDGWYSCPKAIDGCSDESAGTECNCGADRCNAIIDAYRALVREQDGGEK